MSKLYSGAEIVFKCLQDQGASHVFGYPGGAVLPIYDAIFKQNHVRHILVRHEQGAVHAAEGYARSTGKVGVVLVTSGPGATNSVTGLTDAMMDSVPLVCLTGQVPTHMIGNDAFQEADTIGITRPCTKHNYLVRSVDKLSKTLSQRYEKRKGGYCRVIRAGYRYGDDAPMAVIELVDRDLNAKKVDVKKKAQESEKTSAEPKKKDLEKKIKKSKK